MLSFFLPVYASSQEPIINDQMTISDFILLIIALIVVVAGVFSIIYVLWGGILLILSGGKEDKIRPAINSIRYAFIGLIVIVVAIFIFPRIAALFGIDVSKYSSPQLVFNEIKRLGDRIFGTSSSSVPYGNSPSSPTWTPRDFSDL